MRLSPARDALIEPGSLLPSRSYRHVHDHLWNRGIGDFGHTLSGEALLVIRLRRMRFARGPFAALRVTVMFSFWHDYGEVLRSDGYVVSWAGLQRGHSEMSAGKTVNAAIFDEEGDV